MIFVKIFILGFACFCLWFGLDCFARAFNKTRKGGKADEPDKDSLQ